MNRLPQTKDYKFHPRKRYSSWRRWLIVNWWALSAFLVISFVGSILQALLSRGINDLQAALLIVFVRDHPILAGSILLLLFTLTAASHWISRNLTQGGAGEQVTVNQNVNISPVSVYSVDLNPVIAPAGLPRPISFIGRQRDLEELLHELRAGKNTGVFALAGMGGVGKTALAAEAVAQLSIDTQAFPGGAVWIACEDLQGQEGMAEVWLRVARALGLEQVAALADQEARRTALQAALWQRQRLLLALDSVDGLEADTLLETLAIHEHTVLLLTARQHVALHRLHALELHPLEASDARTLFLRRLHEIDKTRSTTADETVLPQLLERLGGLPLAIELTAAYTALQGLPLQRVLQEIEHDNLQSEALQDGHLRQWSHRALQSRFDRSWQQLSLAQQRLFAGLALLEGPSFPRQAALAVAEAAVQEDGVDDPSVTPAGTLAALINYALVELLPGERYRLHPLLRAYAESQLTRLPLKQPERLGEAMFAFWLAYAQAHPGYEGLDALEAEAAGLMGALVWAHRYNRHRNLLEIVHALNLLWAVRGRIADQQLALPWALVAAKKLGDRGQECWSLYELAHLYLRTGQLEFARHSYEQALELAT